MKTRYLKVIRDLTSDYGKNLMLVIAIAIGVFGIGAILGGYSVIKREMTDNYLGTVPASATIEVDAEISTLLVNTVREIPGIKEAEKHATLLARMKVGDKWYPLLLFIVDDFNNKKTNKINHLSGDMVPSTGTMLVERTAFVMMQAREGDEILVKTPNGRPQKIKLSGTVHDPGLAPAWQQQTGYGYITLATLQKLGESTGFNQLRILVSEKPFSREHITAKAREVAEKTEQMGYKVRDIQIPPPGKHPHQGQMSAVMSIFVVFSFFILILGSILVATSMATLMVRQVRQIGIMKTIGANSWQIGGLYLIMMMTVCVMALAVAIPLSRIAASAFYHQLAVLLNLEIRNDSIPFWVLMLQVGSGIGIPMCAVAFPVIRGSRISVRDALDNYGLARQKQGISWVSSLSQNRYFGETFRLSIRNVFRQRSRVLLTLGLLAAGGAMFMTALNVSEAWEDNLSRIYSQRFYDLEVGLNNPIVADPILKKIRSLPGVSYAEGWNASPTSFLKEKSFEVTHTYPDKGHGSFTLQALPVPTKLLVPTVVEGKWLTNSKTNDVVLNQSARGLVKLGDDVTLSIDGKASTWHVIGFTEDVGSSALAYVSNEVFSTLTGTPGMADVLRVAYSDRSKTNAMRMNREVEKLLEKERVTVNTTLPVWVLHNAVAAHMKVLVNSLMAMAILMALVGTIGLTSAMSMSILERTLEIGVMRAIGATPQKIRNLIVWEGFLIGAFSIIFAFALSAVFSAYMGRLIGNMAFRTPLSLTISWLAIGIWMLIIVVGSYCAAVFPAKRANGVSIREALGWE